MAGIPILMYHSISDTNEADIHPYYRTCTAPRIFAEQMKSLVTRGYKTVGLNEAINAIGHGCTWNNRNVVLTFDDGFEDFYREAYPILAHYSCHATVFLPTAYMRVEHRAFSGKNCLCWNQVKELHRLGVQFGSHTATHPQLSSLSWHRIRHELRSSKQSIEDRIGDGVVSFSYPYAFPEADGDFRKTFGSVLLDAGYDSGVTTMIGTAGQSSDRLFLERIPINSEDDQSLFMAKLEGGYDWLHMVQFVSKCAGRIFR